MSPLSNQNPVARFDGLADLYARCRPSYPDEAIEYILSTCRLEPGATLVDVGSGTGISSRSFATRGLQVIGIEPNEDMRNQAESHPLPDGSTVPQFRSGTAETTGLDDATANAVLCAQSFHWFAADKALGEFRRILKNDGWVILMWNERDDSDAFTAEYSRVIRSSPGAAALEQSRASSGEVLLGHELFRGTHRVAFPNEQILNAEEMLGRAFSASYAPRDPAAANELAADLVQVFTKYQYEGKISLKYQTSLFLGRK